MKKRYYDFNTHLRETYGCRVQKITIDAGLTCPNRDGAISTGGCIYCNPRGSGTGAHIKGMSVTDQINHGKKVLGKRYKAKKFIAYFQSYTNTYAPINKLQRLYEAALAVDGVVGLSIGTRPDCISESVLNLLQDYADTHLIWMEYGLQSAHEATLSFINRGHDFQSFSRAVTTTQNRGIKICAHVILGLPNERKEQMISTAHTVAGMNIDGIKLHLLYVVKGTKMEQLYKQGDYRCLEQQEYADIVCDFLECLPPKMVIHRLTGDPHPRELIAPGWSLKKAETLVKINQILEQRDSYQGKCFISEQ